MPPLRILVIEDSVEVATMLRKALTFEGHDVVVAHDGRTGVEVAGRHAPHLVLCDLGLPGALDGCGVARALREQGSRACLVALSGYAGGQHRSEALGAGFDRHLAKPLRYEDLQGLCAAIGGAAGDGVEPGSFGEPV